MTKKRFLIERARHEAHSNYGDSLTLEEAIEWAHEIARRGSFVTSEILETFDEQEAYAAFSELNSSATVLHKENAHSYLWEIDLYLLSVSTVELDEGGNIEDEYNISEKYAPFC